MSTLQVILIALFIYLGAIGSIVGNTIGWYCLGRPLVASFVVGIIMGDVQTAMLVGVPLQIAYLANVTPGGAVAWDLSYATYVGTAMAIALKGTVGAGDAMVGGVLMALDQGAGRRFPPLRRGRRLCKRHDGRHATAERERL